MRSGLGSWGEAQAITYLRNKRYVILEKNFRVWEGEIDIIAQKDEKIIFVEVKTRASNRYGFPEDSLLPAKQERLLKAGFKYLEDELMGDMDYQFDFIAIECTRARRLTRLTHYEDVIGMDC